MEYMKKFLTIFLGSLVVVCVTAMGGIGLAYLSSVYGPFVALIVMLVGLAAVLSAIFVLIAET